MHRIASLGDMQESNKNERHHPAPDKNVAAGGTRPGFDEEGKAALVDFGKVFEAVMKHTVAGTTTTSFLFYFFSSFFFFSRHPLHPTPFPSNPLPLCPPVYACNAFFKAHHRDSRLFYHSRTATVCLTL